MTAGGLSDLPRPLSLEAADAWFTASGYAPNDPFLAQDFERFRGSHAFVTAAPLAPGSTILDLGAHWLHQALFFAADGHRVIAADVPAVIENELVRSAAERMGAQLADCAHLDRGEGLEAPESSVDLVLMGEILEHLAFNPVAMWRAIHRIVKPGGRVVITTPNALHYERLHGKLSALFARGEYGIDVDEVISTGPRGHHWKEYSTPEIERYFARLSPDFVITRMTASSPGKDIAFERAFLKHLLRGGRRIGGVIDFPALLRRLERRGWPVFGSQLLIDIRVDKRLGVTATPGWES